MKSKTARQWDSRYEWRAVALLSVGFGLVWARPLHDSAPVSGNDA